MVGWGQYFDHETGFHYNYHRYYDPRTGRYLRPDPSHLVRPRRINIPHSIPYLFTNSQELNLYSYAQDSPTNLSDPLGLFAEGLEWRKIPEYQKNKRCGRWKKESGGEVIGAESHCTVTMKCVDPYGLILKKKRFFGIADGCGNCFIPEEGQLCCISI